MAVRGNGAREPKCKNLALVVVAHTLLSVLVQCSYGDFLD